MRDEGADVEGRRAIEGKLAVDHLRRAAAAPRNRHHHRPGVQVAVDQALLFRQEDIAELGDAAAQLLVGAQLRRQIGDGGRALVRRVGGVERLREDVVGRDPAHRRVRELRLERRALGGGHAVAVRRLVREAHELADLLGGVLGVGAAGAQRRAHQLVAVEQLEHHHAALRVEVQVARHGAGRDAAVQVERGRLEQHPLRRQAVVGAETLNVRRRLLDEDAAAASVAHRPRIIEVAVGDLGDGVRR